ncbi:cold-shock protein [Rhodovulum imhoffii]|nr:cold shock domain-containing protein [Rhodovulum imhoffii]MBK5934960.1 cold-shock protein [Rhodovulum imhoffii]
MSEDDKECRDVYGRVKWFDPGKGFGFVVADEGGQDILLHANVLRNFGQSSVVEGAGVRVRVQSTQRGQQAIEILEITPPDGLEQAPLRDLAETTDSDLEALPLLPGRVKWFDKAKGFGFANVFSEPGDVFIHVEVLRRSGLSELQPGEAICLRIVQGPRGRMAAMVLAWEAAVHEARA